MSAPVFYRHDGGECPVAGDVLVRVMWRNRQPAKQDYRAGQLRWLGWPWGESDWDIIRWRHAM